MFFKNGRLQLKQSFLCNLYREWHVLKICILYSTPHVTNAVLATAVCPYVYL